MIWILDNFYFCLWILIKLFKVEQNIVENRKKILEKSGKFVSHTMWEPWMKWRQTSEEQSQTQTQMLSVNKPLLISC